jgi:hypothetical protein
MAGGARLPNELKPQTKCAIWLNRERCYADWSAEPVPACATSLIGRGRKTRAWRVSCPFDQGHCSPWEAARRAYRRSTRVLSKCGNALLKLIRRSGASPHQLRQAQTPNQHQNRLRCRTSRAPFSLTSTNSSSVRLSMRSST